MRTPADQALFDALDFDIDDAETRRRFAIYEALAAEDQRAKAGTPYEPTDAEINEFLKGWDSPSQSDSLSTPELTVSPATTDTPRTAVEGFSETVGEASYSFGKEPVCSFGKNDGSEQQAGSETVSEASPGFPAPEKPKAFSGEKSSPTPHCQNTPTISDSRPSEPRQAEATARGLGRLNPSPSPLTPWERLTLSERLPFYESAIEGEPAHSFTLDPSPKIQTKAKLHEDGPAEYLRRRIGYQLAKHFPRVPHYLFAVQISESGQLHLHGVIQIPDGGRKSAETALRAAGDVLPDKNQKHGFQRVQKLLDVKRYYRGGWSNYFMRSRRRDGKELTGRLFYVTAPLRERARLLYEQVSRS